MNKIQPHLESGAQRLNIIKGLLKNELNSSEIIHERVERLRELLKTCKSNFTYYFKINWG